MHAPRALAVAVGVMLALRAAAQPAMPATPESASRRLLLEVCFNDTCHGLALVEVRDGELWIERAVLEAAGITPGDAASRRIGQRELIPASALERVAVVLDEAGGRLDLRQAAQDMPHHTVDMRTRVAGDAVPYPWSGFVNHALTLGEHEDRSAYFDAAFGRGHGALRTTALWDDVYGWQRGLSRLEFDQPGRMRSWIIGDQIAAARDPLGGGALLGGIGVARAFEQDPYLVTFPQPFYQGVLQEPATVEVYSNGVLLSRRDVGAGPFTLEGLGLSPGRNDVQLVAVDPFGHRQSLSTSSYYGSSAALAPGLSDYAIHVGLPREGGGWGGHYGDSPALQAYYRSGVNQVLTLGVRVEADNSFVNVGGDAVWRSPLGEWSLALSGSDADSGMYASGGGGGGGHAAAIGYSYAAPRFGVALGWRRFDAAYRSLGQSALFAALREDGYLNLSWTPDARLAWQLNLGHRRYDAQPLERTRGLMATLRLAARAQLLASVYQTVVGDARDVSAYLSLTFSLDRSSVGLSARREDVAGVDRDGIGLDARRSRPAGTGWGYDLSVQRLDGTTGFGQVEYQGPHGRVALQSEQFDGERHDRVVLSGAVTGIGGRLFATPPLESGFALVRVPGVEDIPVQRENNTVGRTDAAGDLLVRELMPFYPSKLSLDVRELPVDYRVLASQSRIAVPRNTGALVALDVVPLRAVTGHVRLRDAGGDRAAEYGRMRLRPLDPRTASVPLPEALLGASGRYYFEDLSPGRYAVQIDSGNRRANCELDVAPSSPGVADLGDLLCTVVENAGEQP